MTVVPNKLDALTNQSIDIASQFLSWVKQMGEAGSATIQEQTPLFIQELMTWFSWMHIMYAVGFSILVVILLMLIRPLYKWNIWSDKNSSHYGCHPLYPLTICGMVICGIAILIITTAGIIPHTINAVKATVAPRVYLAEWVIEKTQQPRFTR